jgi:chromosome condensin MukBEF complex kleisin-like MukF subunit
MRLLKGRGRRQEDDAKKKRKKDNNSKAGEEGEAKEAAQPEAHLMDKDYVKLRKTQEDFIVVANTQLKELQDELNAATDAYKSNMIMDRMEAIQEKNQRLLKLIEMEGRHKRSAAGQAAR